MSLRTLVVIPAYNEADALPDVLRELRRRAPQHDVVVVSDGSEDRTADAARESGVPVVELPFNLGIGGALRAGFHYAVLHGYDVGIQFDADGQHDPAEIEKLLVPLRAGADMVIGSRFGDTDGPAYDVGWLRRRAMVLLEWLVTLLVGRRFRDTSSGFRAFSRPMLEYFARTYPVEYLDSVEALVLASNAGFRVEEVRATMRPRASGEPSTRHVKLIYYYVRLIVVMLSSAQRRGRHLDGGPS